MKGDPILQKAALLAKKRDFESAYKILQNEEDRYNGSFKYYNLFGLVSLHSGSYLEAYEYLQLAKRVKFKDKSTMLGLAALYLKRLKTVQAVDFYLDVMEIDPKNRIAKYALDVIRKHSTHEALSDWIASPQKFAKLFPPIPAPLINKRTLLKGALVFAGALAITAGVLVTAGVIPNPFRTQSERLTTELFLTREERSEPIETSAGGLYRYILTSAQALSLYDNALSLFGAYRDEAAKINLNRILESNASESLKNRSRLLLSKMTVPGFDTFNRSDNPSFSDVRNEPVIFRNVHVIWRGMATNVEITDAHTRFDFLVGYDTRRVLEGIIPCYFSVPVAVNTDRPLEVLGRIIPDNTNPNGFRLDGVSIHQSGRLGN